MILYIMGYLTDWVFFNVFYIITYTCVIFMFVKNWFRHLFLIPCDEQFLLLTQIFTLFLWWGVSTYIHCLILFIIYVVEQLVLQKCFETSGKGSI